jgi:hypothetical protein
MSVMQEGMELADSVLIISLINLFMMINSSTEGLHLLLQFHKQKSMSKLVIFKSLETHWIDVTVWGALLLHDICKNAVTL